jgi:hypothetical protein
VSDDNYSSFPPEVFLDFFSIDDIFVLLRASQTGPLEETVGRAPGRHWEFKGSRRSERDKDGKSRSGEGGFRHSRELLGL